MPAARNLKNQKYGRLLVLEFSHSVLKFKKKTSKKYKLKYWKCLCDCGNYVIVQQMDLLKGDTKSCGCWHSERSKLQCVANRLKEGEASFNSLYTRYRTTAKRKNLDFNLTKEQFRAITSKDCDYCGVKPNRTHQANHAFGAYLYNGIDRKDNTKGYIINNITPCCAFCNAFKSYFLSYKEMKQVIKLLKHFRKKENIWKDFILHGHKIKKNPIDIKPIILKTEGKIGSNLSECK